MPEADPETVAREALIDAKAGTPGPWEYDHGEMQILPSPSDRFDPAGRAGWVGEASNGQDGRIIARMRAREPLLAAALLLSKESLAAREAEVDELKREVAVMEDAVDAARGLLVKEPYLRVTECGVAGVGPGNYLRDALDKLARIRGAASRGAGEEKGNG